MRNVKAKRNQNPSPKVDIPELGGDKPLPEALLNLVIDRYRCYQGLVSGKPGADEDSDGMELDDLLDLLERISRHKDGTKLRMFGKK